MTTSVSPSPGASCPTCDAHFHVFGPQRLYPAVADALYPPPDASLQRYLQLAQEMRVERFVLVQPSIYGTDNRCMLDALRILGSGRARAVVDIDEQVANDRFLDQLHCLGVRAARMHTHRPVAPGLAEAWRPRLARLAALAAEIGWSIDFLMPGWLTGEILPRLHELRVDFTIAHLGYFQAERGVEQHAFRGLLDLLRSGPGHCWVKLSGFYRMSRREDCADVRPFVQALVEIAPDRLIWGSDYPHVYVSREIDTPRQLSLLSSWLPDEGVRRQVMAENAARLYGFVPVGLTNRS